MNEELIKLGLLKINQVKIQRHVVSVVPKEKRPAMQTNASVNDNMNWNVLIHHRNKKNGHFLLSLMMQKSFFQKRRNIGQIDKIGIRVKIRRTVLIVQLILQINVCLCFAVISFVSQKMQWSCNVMCNDPIANDIKHWIQCHPLLSNKQEHWWRNKKFVW